MTDDGWIPWNGGECPVDHMTRVDVQFRSGIPANNFQAGFWSAFGPTHDHWRHEDSDRDIIAYRLTETET